jgi:hypothetical protein
MAASRGLITSLDGYSNLVIFKQCVNAQYGF